MLSKMNQEYEKMLIQSSNSDKLIISLKREISDLKMVSDHNISSLDVQLKVRFWLLSTAALGCPKR